MIKMVKAGVLAALLFGFASANAATVQNGSFEDIGGQSLNGSGWNQFASIPGFTGVPNIEIQSSATLDFIDAQDGENYAELDTNQNSGLYQDVVLAAGKYALSFWYSPRVDATPTTTNDLSFSIADGNTNLVAETINGAPNPDYPHGVWTLVTEKFTVAADTVVQLAFYATGQQRTKGCGDCGALIDNIAIAPVPLPAGLLLLGSALLGFGAMRRRTNIAAAV